MGVAAGAWFALRPGYVDDVPPPPAHLQALPGTHALLVGCTDYPYLREECLADGRGAALYDGRMRLAGPAPDVDLMVRTLHDYLGVPRANIQTLVGWPDDPAARPTRANILGALDALAQRVQAGDRVVFHFAGHGSQQPDLEGDEADKMDEILLPADVRGWDGELAAVPQSISDDELNARFAAIADTGASVFAIFDCCHAGSLSRDPTVRLRQLPPELLGVPEAPPPDGPPAAAPAAMRATPRVASFYAVGAHQLAPEMRLPVDPRAPDRALHGLFTWHLARTIQRFGGGLSFAELRQHVADAYRAMPYDSVRPSADGDLAMLVAREGAAASLPLHAHLEEDGWRLDAGRLRGLAPGAVLELWKPGATAEGQALGRLQVEAAGPLEATARALGTLTLPVGVPTGTAWPVTILAAAPADVVLPIAVLDADGALATAPPDEWSQLMADPDFARHFPAATSLEDAAWTLRPGRDGWVLQRREAGLGPALEVGPQGLRAALGRVARVQELLSLSASGVAQPLPRGFEADLFWYPRASREAGAAPEGEVHRDDRASCPGEGLRLRIRNRTGDPLDVHVLGIDAAMQVDVLHPHPRGPRPSPRLDMLDNQEIWLPGLDASPWPLNDAGPGVESLVVLVVPRTSNDGPDTDFRHLAQAGFARARGGPATPQLLCARTFTWLTSFDALGIPDAVRAQAQEVAAADRSPLPAPAAQGRPEVAFVGTHALHLPGAFDGRGVASRAALWLTFDELALQVHVGLDPQGLVATGPAAAIRAAAAAGTLGGDLVFRITPEERASWFSTPDGDVVQQVPRAPGAQAWRHERGPGAAWARHPSLAPWLSMDGLPRRRGVVPAVLEALEVLRMR